jgi:hypothetical protein
MWKSKEQAGEILLAVYGAEKMSALISINFFICRCITN